MLIAFKYVKITLIQIIQIIITVTTIITTIIIIIIMTTTTTIIKQLFAIIQNWQFIVFIISFKMQEPLDM